MQKGGCLCGAVRYEVDQPPLAEAVCHCKNCQRQSGSAFSVLQVVRAKSFKLTGVEPKCYLDRGDSGNEVQRHFCGTCGSPVYTSQPAAPKLLFVKAGTLDDTSALAPQTHVWCSSAWPWTSIPPDAVRHARNLEP